MHYQVEVNNEKQGWKIKTETTRKYTFRWKKEPKNREKNVGKLLSLSFICIKESKK